MSVPTEHLIALASVLFALGVFGFLTRRNVIIVLASIELMLNAANLAFIAGSRAWSDPTAGGHPVQGTIFVLFVVLIAAAEAAVGLALIIALYRLKQSAAVEAASELHG